MIKTPIKYIEVDEEILQRAKVLVAGSHHDLKHILKLAIIDGIQVMEDVVDGGGEL